MGMAHHLGKFKAELMKAEDKYEAEPTEENRNAVIDAEDCVEDARMEARMEWEGEQ